MKALIAVKLPAAIQSLLLGITVEDIHKSNIIIETVFLRIIKEILANPNTSCMYYYLVVLQSHRPATELASTYY